MHECSNVNDLDHEDDVNPKRVCTSNLQKWHRRGREDSIQPQAVMDVIVHKTKVQDSSSSKISRDPGIKCLLYEARNTIQTGEGADEVTLQRTLQEINPNMALAQILTSLPSSTEYIETRFGNSPRGSFASYQLAFTEDNVKVFLDLSSIQRTVTPVSNDEQLQYPKFPIENSGTNNFTIPPGLDQSETKLLESLIVKLDKLNDIERTSQAQSESDDWKKERLFRFTASNFGLISNRKRHHDTLVNNILHPKPFVSRYTLHGNKYEPVAIRQYQKYMHSIKKPVVVYKSGLVVSYETPFLGASPDGKVIDTG